MTTTPAVEVRGLIKSFGDVRALDGLDLTVDAGSVAGFLGPNGAGKSTTLRILLGLLRADGGTARLLGGDPWADAVALHRRLAYVPGDVALWPALTGGEVIDLLGRLRGRTDARRRAELLERFALDPSRKIRAYSKGNRQKVALVAALAADVDLLVLDEPTSGLDPLMEEVFTECIGEARAVGRSVLLSSHVLSEVEKLCDTVTIIRNGRTVESGTLAELRHLTRSTVTAGVSADPSGLAALPGVHDLSRDGHRVRFQVDNAHLDTVVAALATLGLNSLVCAPPSLEELFLQHYGDALPAPDPVGAR
jgi:ABC-2 type transport system ATP-binding protein